MGSKSFEILPDLCLNEKKTECFPQSYVLGGQKCGTAQNPHPCDQLRTHRLPTSSRSGSTSVYQLLADTFGVCGAQVCAPLHNLLLLHLIHRCLLSPASPWPRSQAGTSTNTITNYHLMVIKKLITWAVLGATTGVHSQNFTVLR